MVSEAHMKCRLHWLLSHSDSFALIGNSQTKVSITFMQTYVFTRPFWGEMNEVQISNTWQLCVVVIPPSVISGKWLDVLPSAGNAEFSEHTLSGQTLCRSLGWQEGNMTHSFQT